MPGDGKPGHALQRALPGEVSLRRRGWERGHSGPYNTRFLRLRWAGAKFLDREFHKCSGRGRRLGPLCATNCTGGQRRLGIVQNSTSWFHHDCAIMWQLCNGALCHGVACSAVRTPHLPKSDIGHPQALAGLHNRSMHHACRGERACVCIVLCPLVTISDHTMYRTNLACIN